MTCGESGTQDRTNPAFHHRSLLNSNGNSCVSTEPLSGSLPCAEPLKWLVCWLARPHPPPRSIRFTQAVDRPRARASQSDRIPPGRRRRAVGESRQLRHTFGVSVFAVTADDTLGAIGTSSIRPLRGRGSPLGGAIELLECCTAELACGADVTMPGAPHARHLHPWSPSKSTS